MRLMNAREKDQETPLMGAFADVQATILLVDDRPENLVALEAVLEPLGHRLLRATSGEEALKYLLTEDVALILLDVQMPGMDGFETALRIKERDSTREIPILFLTAYSTDAVHAIQGFDTGAVDYITKPLDPWLLRAKVRIFIELYQKTRILQEQSRVLALRLAQRYETEARNLRKLADAAVVINSTLSLDEIFRVINSSAREVIGAREADTVIHIHDGDVSAIYRWVLERQEPVRMTKKEIQANFVLRGLFDIAPGHPMLEGWLAAPLIGRTGRTLGLIQVADKVEGDFTESDEVVLLQLAQLAAVAIENAERYEHERHIAETLQRSLLPEALPRIFGLELAAHYQPGSHGTWVGGDWYDVFALDSHRVALAVGDVVGRGPRAAAVMGQLQTAIRAYAIHGLGPADLMSSLDRLVQGMSESMLATAVYGVLDLATQRLELVSAGHLPPLLVPPTAAPRYVDVDPNLPLGAVRLESYTSSVLDLGPGWLLLFYTDGLVEERSRSLDEGLNRLAQVIDPNEQSLEHLCQYLVCAMVPAEKTDDVALLAARLR
jgi:serine phosphatase RsbU (regulator of sigma subunit)/DNA-binding response OmpR family regulator